MKGHRKRQKSRFKTGSVPHNKGKCSQALSPDLPSHPQYKRLCSDDFDLVSVTEETSDGIEVVRVKDVEGQVCHDVKLLRPRPAPPTYLEKICSEKPSRPSMNTYKLMQPSKVEELWQTGIAEHSEQHPTCNGKLMLDDSDDVQVGLCWQQRLRCTECDYTSARHKLYDEVERGRRGRKAAAPNLAVQVGLTHTPMSNTGLRTLLNSANIAAPALSSMQSHTNSVNATLVQVNQKDMKARREKLKEVNKLKGLQEDAPIRVEGDARYNNPLFTAAGTTPFQPASQVVYTMCENVTQKKQIIAVATNNKLCQTGARQAEKTGNRPRCCAEGSTEHGGHCSATIAADHCIGDEHAWATNCVEDLLGDGLKIKYFTSDCDSRASSAAADCYRNQRIDHSKPVHLKDTIHLGRALRRNVKKSTFSSRMFSGRLAADRAKTKSRFADDLVRRCAAEHDAAYARFKEDSDNVSRSLSYCVDAIIKCYQGDHSICQRRSFVCDGSPSNSWKRTCMHKNSQITCTDNDERLLRDCINKRIGKKTVHDTRFHTNTQKCESVNKVYSLRNPKNLTLARNFHGRIHSTVHQLNNGPGESLCKQLAAVGTPISPGSTIAHQLKQKQYMNNYHKQYKKTPSAKSRRCSKRIHKYRLYDAKSTDERVHYQSQILEVSNLNTRCQQQTEHNYCKTI